MTVEKDFQKLVEKLQQALVRIGMWKDTSNVNEINEMFDAVIGRIGIPATTTKGRQRRVGQLGWRTAYKLMGTE